MRGRQASLDGGLDIGRCVLWDWYMRILNRPVYFLSAVGRWQGSVEDGIGRDSACERDMCLVEGSYEVERRKEEWNLWVVGGEG